MSHGSKILIVVIAPSGGGKSSLIARALKEFPQIEDTVTVTTRPMRKGESQGNPYKFVSLDEFESIKSSGQFVEWAQVHTHWYGTPTSHIEAIWNRGHVAIIDVDIQGARSLRLKYPRTATIFVLPPSIDALRDRVVKRDGQPPKDLAVRMKNAALEISMAHEFEYQIMNDDFERAYREFKKIIAEVVNQK